LRRLYESNLRASAAAHPRLRHNARNRVALRISAARCAMLARRIGA
jgi:hypothetical protein